MIILNENPPTTPNSTNFLSKRLGLRADYHSIIHLTVAMSCFSCQFGGQIVTESQ